MDRVEREIQRAIDDVKREQAAERRANEADAHRTEQPADTPRGNR